MLARIIPSPLKGTVPAIASKSMAHRLIICAALANGETHVTCNTTRHRGYGALSHGPGRSHRDRRGRLPGPSNHEKR